MLVKKVRLPERLDSPEFGARHSQNIVAPIGQQQHVPKPDYIAVAKRREKYNGWIWFLVGI
jgi:hypothetical protein